MQTFGGLGLMAALVLCYLLYFRSSQPATGDLGSEDAKTAATVSGKAGEPVSGAHSIYKVEIDRAHAAAKQMQVTRTDEAASE